MANLRRWSSLVLLGDQAFVGEHRQRRIDHARARRVVAARTLLHRLDQVVAVARLLGDQLAAAAGAARRGRTAAARPRPAARAPRTLRAAERSARPERTARAERSAGTERPAGTAAPAAAPTAWPASLGRALPGAADRRDRSIRSRMSRSSFDSLRYILDGPNARGVAAHSTSAYLCADGRLVRRRPAARPAQREPRADAPLADRLRPRALDEVIGQEHLTGPEGAIGRMVAAGKLSSMVLWGPPGTGKTTHRPPARRRRRHALRRDQRGVLGRRRPQEGLRRGRDDAQGGPAHAAVRGRDPPLQPRPAGRLPALSSSAAR